MLIYRMRCLFTAYSGVCAFLAMLRALNATHDADTKPRQESGVLAHMQLYL